jgi:hypothetical protein
MNYEPCPLCAERGTRDKRDGRYRPGNTPQHSRCELCRGDGSLPLSRLLAVIRRGLRRA